MDARKKNYSFTEKQYVKLLDSLIKNEFKAVGYEKHADEGRLVLLRHDVDVSPHRAYALAKLEASRNIKSTYFLMLNSDMYNLLERDVRRIIYQIIELGHDIGLHFDPTFYEINKEDDLIKALKFEKLILEEVFSINISSFSLHNPTPESLVFDKESYAGMVNAYSKNIQSCYKYCSDSNGYWRFDIMDDLINPENEKLHLLTHPVWWQRERLSPRSRIERSIKCRAKRVSEMYDEQIKRYNRINIK